MRPIKFRKWHDPLCNGEYRMTYSEDLANEKGEFVFHDGILMQFVGLFDDEGREIYEGDIVEVTEYNTPPHRSVVCFGHSGAWIEGHPLRRQLGLSSAQPLSDYCDYGIGQGETATCKVLGNVFETPEHTPEPYKRIVEKELFFLFAKQYYEDWSHPFAVACQFPELSDEWIVGLFHDLLEDTDVDPKVLQQFLSKMGKGRLFQEIEKITRKENEPYFQYIARLNGIAKMVKIADIRHHLARKETLKESLKERYVKALNILKGSIE
ncbi:YopX family protein [Geobacillus subterraneus]|uniref:YopX family protein n=1 Tax=Geobacillus subterraneus TaxID=129338 RepID=UPI001553FF07|nr:YopX family protein [Geobacillus subterraneus]